MRDSKLSLIFYFQFKLFIKNKLLLKIYFKLKIQKNEKNKRILLYFKRNL